MTGPVVIVGGGTGATILANSLARRHIDVTVVSATGEHLFQPALLYIAFTGGHTHIARPERQLLSGRVRLVQDTVTAVDLERRSIDTRSGAVIAYDRLVLATGARTDASSIAGLADVVARYGDYHTDVPQALKLRHSLDAFRGGTIVVGQASPVCKCPPSPIEGALLVDRLLRRRGVRSATRLVFFTPYPRPYPAEAINNVVEPLLTERGIEVMPFFDVDRVDTETRTINSIEGDAIVYDLPILVPPFVGTDIVYTPAHVVDEDRFIVTDKRTLRVVGLGDAFAIGDCTNLPTSKAGVGAHLEALVVARALTGRSTTFSGRTHCPLDLADGRGMFVAGSYDAPVARSRPSRRKRLMKMAFAWIYWWSLRGWIEPLFTAYFRLTDPARAARVAPSRLSAPGRLHH